MERLCYNMSDKSSKSKAELIDEKLMGLEINDGDKTYGVIVRIDQINNDFKVYTNLGYSFNAGLILNLVAIANLEQRAAEKAEQNDDENVEYLPPAFIDNAIVSNKIMNKPRPMAHSKQMRMNGTISNTADVGDDKVDITTYTSPKQKFQTKEQIQETKRREREGK